MLKTVIKSPRLMCCTFSTLRRWSISGQWSDKMGIKSGDKSRKTAAFANIQYSASLAQFLCPPPSQGGQSSANCAMNSTHPAVRSGSGGGAGEELHETRCECWTEFQFRDRSLRGGCGKRDTLSTLGEHIYIDQTRADTPAQNCCYFASVLPRVETGD